MALQQVVPLTVPHLKLFRHAPIPLHFLVHGRLSRFADRLSVWQVWPGEPHHIIDILPQVWHDIGYNQLRSTIISLLFNSGIYELRFTKRGLDVLNRPRVRVNHA